MDTAYLDREMQTLAENKKRWATLPINEKIAFLDSIRERTVEQARVWVEDAVKAKKLRMDHHLAGEEWTSGPFSVLSVTSDLRRTLVRLAEGVPVLDGYDVRQAESGQVAVDVFPASLDDRLLFSGVTAEVRMRPDVTLENLDDTVATFYRDPDPPGDVSVVLAAGNIASIAVLDVVYAMFNEGKVAILKMNPVNDYLGQHFEEIFADLADEGFVRFAYGGADVGAHLTSHPLADSVHITGSAATYEAIVFGPGAVGQENKAKGLKVNTKPIGAELGGVGPVIVVPGDWTKADLRHQAESIVSMKMHNSGFNCVAAQVLVMPRGWEHGDALLDEIRALLDEIDVRDPYYPGAVARIEAMAEGGHDVEVYGGEHSVYLLPDVDPDGESGPFTTEVFGPALAVVHLAAPDVPSYLINATQFANERLAGTLGANVIIDRSTRKKHAAAFERTLSGLEYGTIAVNTWTGAAYFLSACAWGAFPGHTPEDIGSGVGVVHNTLMFDKAEKSIVWGPFASAPRSFLKGERHVSPKLVYFVTNRNAHEIGERLIDYSATESKADLAKVAVAALKG